MKTPVWKKIVSTISPIKLSQDFLLPNIIITPFDESYVGPNSYDLHLGGTLKVYDLKPGKFFSLDKEPDTLTIKIPESGYVLKPGIFYLGETLEWTETRRLVPKIDGRSSIGRMSILVHFTAGFGDDGFRGKWTLEMSTMIPWKVKPRMKIGQIYYENLQGRRKPYQGRYQNQPGVEATRYYMGENFK